MTTRECLRELKIGANFLSVAELACCFEDASSCPDLLPALQISRLSKQNGARPRTVVITQGKDDTIVAYLNKVQMQTASFLSFPFFTYSFITSTFIVIVSGLSVTHIQPKCT